MFTSSMGPVYCCTALRVPVRDVLLTDVTILAVSRVGGFHFLFFIFYLVLLLFFLKSNHRCTGLPTAGLPSETVVSTSGTQGMSRRCALFMLFFVLPFLFSVLLVFVVLLFIFVYFYLFFLFLFIIYYFLVILVPISMAQFCFAHDRFCVPRLENMWCQIKTKLCRIRHRRLFPPGIIPLTDRGKRLLLY